MDFIGTYEEKPFPKSRKFFIDTLEEGSSKHHVYGLIETDVTKARQYLRDRKSETGKRLSFTGWIVKCISQAVSEQKHVHAYRHGRGKLVIFDDVDIVVVVERFVDGNSLNFPYIVRKANEKSVEEISEEIQVAKVEKLEDGTVVLGEGMNPRLAKLANWAPKFIRQMYWRKLRHDAFLVKKTMGTVVVTSVGMFGKSSGHIIPIGVHTLGFGLGGITKKPAVIGDKIEIREYLSMTVSVDHDIVDGAPLARFVARLTELVENAFGLIDEV